MTESACQLSPAVGVRFIDLSVRRDDRSILQNITATAPAGGATVLIGPNGAGKTTLLRCLLGEVRYSGQIEYFLPEGAPCSQPVIGYVPQQLMADPQTPLRVYEFMALGCEKLPLWLGCSAKTRKNGQAALALVGAEKLEKRRLSDLSGGELRRVLLASALARKPRLLVLDEAEAGVDYQGERLFWEILDKTRHELGFTLLVVSHNLPLAAHYATNVFCIRQKLLAHGAPEKTLTTGLLLELFGVPIHLYPQQCKNAGPACVECGAFGNLPHAGGNGLAAKPKIIEPIA